MKRTLAVLAVMTTLPLVALAPFEASAIAKLRLALQSFAEQAAS